MSNLDFSRTHFGRGRKYVGAKINCLKIRPNLYKYPVKLSKIYKPIQT